MSKPDPPSPPNPIATAAAQTGTNVSTAVANSYLNNVNQNTPDGSLSYEVTGNYNWTDPVSGQTYNIPRFTSNQTLSPMGQAIKGQTDQTKFNLAQMGNQQSGRVSSLLSTPFNPNLNAQTYLQQNPDVLAAARAQGVDPMQFAAQHYQNYGQAEGRSGGSPAGGNAQNILNVPKAATSYDQGGQIQRSFGGYGDVTTSYGPGDFSSDRQHVEDALMARMNPQLQIEQQRIQQQLADQGIRPGSQAYADSMATYGRQANDARYGAISQAGQEQQRMMDMAAQRAGFQNAAQQQQYEQSLGSASFANQAQGQQNQQNAAQAAFGNAGLAQQLAQQQSGFNAQNSQRNQYMQEQYQQRNQPLNEISALMSGSQLQQPNWLNSPTSQIPTTDFAGITNQNFQNQMGIYNAQNQNYQQIMGGILGLGAGALKASDRRVKENIKPMGSVLAARGDAPKMATVFSDDDRSELPIYAYSYKNDPSGMQHVGPMAQDVEKIDPKAVKSIGGVKHIDTRRVMGSILRAA
jgi:hypothetical protein